MNMANWGIFIMLGLIFSELCEITRAIKQNKENKDVKDKE